MLTNSSYDFTTLAPSILGATYKNMKVLGKLSFTKAMKETDVLTKHESVKGIIPGLPNSPQNMEFISFIDANGSEMILALNYIDPATIILVTTIDIDIKVLTVPSSAEAILRQTIRELGYNFQLTVL